MIRIDPDEKTSSTRGENLPTKAGSGANAPATGLKVSESVNANLLATLVSLTSLYTPAVTSAEEPAGTNSRTARASDFSKPDSRALSSPEGALLRYGPEAVGDHITERTLLSAAWVSAEAVRLMPKEFLQDERFVMRTLAGQPTCFQYLPDGVREKRRIAAEAVYQNHHNLRLVPPELLIDKTFLLDVVGMNPYAYQTLSEMVEQVPLDVREDLDIVRAAVLVRAENIVYGPASYPENFICELVTENPLVIRYIERTDRVLDAYRTICEAFDLLEIDHDGNDSESGVERGYFDNAREIVRNRYAALPPNSQVKTALVRLLGGSYFQGVSEDKRPILLAAYPLVDDNGAFQQHEYPDQRDKEPRFRGQSTPFSSGGTYLDHAMRHYRVVFYHIRSIGELTAQLSDVAKHLDSNISCLIIAGHALPDRLNLSHAKDGLLTQESLAQQCPAWRKFLADGALVCFHGCSAGSTLQFVNGRKYSSLVDQAATELTNCYVLGPTEQVDGSGIKYDPNTKEWYFGGVACGLSAEYFGLEGGSLWSGSYEWKPHRCETSRTPVAIDFSKLQYGDQLQKMWDEMSESGRFALVRKDPRSHAIVDFSRDEFEFAEQKKGTEITTVRNCEGLELRAFTGLIQAKISEVGQRTGVFVNEDGSTSRGPDYKQFGEDVIAALGLDRDQYAVYLREDSFGLAIDIYRKHERAMVLFCPEGSNQGTFRSPNDIKLFPDVLCQGEE